MSYAELRLIAENYTASQKTRLANEGRIRSSAVDPDITGPLLELDKATEELQAKALKNFRKTVPAEIRDWQKANSGIGEHLLARLLGVIGDPYVAQRRYWRDGGEGEHKRVLVTGEPFSRKVYNLYAYCGHGDPSRRKFRGMTQTEAMALGSPDAKMLVHLLAESCMKQVRKDPETGDPRSTSKYRDVYDDARVRYSQCVTCYGDPQHPNIAIHLDRERQLREAELLDSSEELILVPMDEDKAVKVMQETHPVCPTCTGSGERTHTSVCIRCGPSGKPAQVGSPWSLKHQHMAALRKVGKALLKDLWIASRDAHLREEQEAMDEASLPERMAAIGSMARVEDKPTLTPKETVNAREEQAAAVG